MSRSVQPHRLKTMSCLVFIVCLQVKEKILRLGPDLAVTRQTGPTALEPTSEVSDVTITVVRVPATPRTRMRVRCTDSPFASR